MAAEQGSLIFPAVFNVCGWGRGGREQYLLYYAPWYLQQLSGHLSFSVVPAWVRLTLPGHS